ncbi:MAG: lysophospholipid acyltransferase family protein [Blastocatellia bacterium]
MTALRRACQHGQALMNELLDNTSSLSQPRTRSARGRLRTYIEFAAAWIVLKTLGLLPRRAAIALAQMVAALARALRPRLTRHALRNLEIAFPGMPAAERMRIERTVFGNLGRLLGEVSQFPRMHRGNIASIVVHEGLEHYQRALAGGRGVILLTGHIGAWELSVFAHSIYGYPMSFLKRNVDNPLVERLAESYRLRHGNRSIDKKGGMREILRTLKSGGVVGILADLNTTREEGVFVDFFGVPACTTAGVATLALRTNAVVLPGYLLWDETANAHRLCFETPIETISTGRQKEDVVANTQQYANALENIIRRYPDQWLWIHRRWKTRPEGAPDLY